MSGIADERRKAEDDAKAALNALARLDAEIAAAEEKERIAADRKVREATSRHLHALADRLEKQSKAFLDAIPRFAETLDEVAGLGSPEMTEFSGLVPLLGHLQVEAGMLLVEHASLVRSRAAATLAGTAPAETTKGPRACAGAPSRARCDRESFRVAEHQVA